MNYLSSLIEAEKEKISSTNDQIERANNDFESQKI